MSATPQSAHPAGPRFIDGADALAHHALAACADVDMASAHDLASAVAAYDQEAEPALIVRAYRLAAAAHMPQRRYSGLPYITHPVAVAEILIDLKLDAATVITALLHDTVEDTPLTLGEVREAFGAEIADLVDGVTKLGQVKKTSQSTDQARNLQKFVLAVAKDVRVLLIKLADRLHNMRTLDAIPKLDKRKRISQETLEIYAPLARRAGVQRLCGELEDLAFRHLDPNGYESIQKRLSADRSMRSAAVAEVSGSVTRKLEEAGVAARMFGREKTPYSIWRKLQTRGLAFDQLADVYAFRVITEDVADCYRALGVIHTTWRCVPERFKDYISTPKPNSYRSLHTTVIGPDNARVELQIRTDAMDRVAERGVAAHWRYKNRRYAFDEEAAKAAGGDPFARMRSLVEIMETGGDPDEFLEFAKLEMSGDQIYAFTPKGDVIALPKGATPVDFAYAVHTDVGDTCVGAKVNGAPKPLRTRLSNGDVVEVIRAATPAPQPEWEHVAVTGRARAGVRRLIRRSEHEEFASIGRAIAEHAFRREGLELADANLAEALKRLELADAEEAYERIGRGRLSAQALLDALFPGRERPEEPTGRALIDDSHARMFVYGQNLTPGVSLRFAKCCSPLPGDRIVGILGADGDSSVEVHTIDCERLEAMDDWGGERWIDLAWTADATQNAASMGRVVATVRNEPGVLAEIAGAVGRSRANITGVRILSRAPDFFDMVFDVEVLDARHLSNIVAAMRACASVVTAERDRCGLGDID